MLIMQTAAAKRSRRRLAEMATICAGAAAVGIWLLPEVPAIPRLAADVGDRILMAGPQHSLSDFVFVAIDDPSMKMDHLWPEDLTDSPGLQSMAAGWPWPRSVYAEAVEKLLAAGASVVVLDLILDAPREGDDALRAVLDTYPGRIVIGSNISPDNAAPGSTIDRTTAIRQPAPTLISDANADPRVGFVNFWPDDVDGVVRQITFRSRRGVNHPDANEYFSLTSRVLQHLDAADRIPDDETPRSMRMGDLTTLPVVPFYSLLLPADWSRLYRDGAIFDGKIIMIGPSAAILQDFHNTPAGRIPGPLLHVNAIAAALGEYYYTPIGATARVGIIVLAAAGALLLTWCLRHPVIAVLALVAATAVYIAMVIAAAINWHVLLDVVQPVSTMMLAGVGCIAWNFAAERRESTRMRSTLERYVSRNVVREILDRRDDFLTALGGTRRPMTVFFSDVRGFTSMSERSDAAALVAQLNEYLAAMVRIIFQHNGTVDKFMGDGIMAVWGNVVSAGNAADACAAAQAALDMHAAVDKLNSDWATRNLPPFTVGMGLHHGEAVFGNIGSTEKMEPTVIGDAVNLASRTEGLTKKYGIPICVSGPCAELIRSQFVLRTADLVQVVGKSQPVEIFALISAATTPAPPWLADWERAIKMFRSRQFAEAAETFRVLPLTDDKLTAIYVARCEAFQATPPPADWTGTEVATSK